MSMMYGFSGCKQSSGQKTETTEVVSEQKVTVEETKKVDIVHSAYLSTKRFGDDYILFMVVKTIDGEVRDIRTLIGDFKIKNNSLFSQKTITSVGTIESSEAGAFSATFDSNSRDSIDAVLEGNTVKGTLKLKEQPPYEFVAKQVEYEICSSCGGKGKGFNGQKIETCSSCKGLGASTFAVLVKNL
jgi:hypothetical protein